MVMKTFRNFFGILAVILSFFAVSCSLFGDEEHSAEENVVEPALTASVRGSMDVSGAAPGAFFGKMPRGRLFHRSGASRIPSLLRAAEGRTRRMSIRRISRSRSTSLRLLRAGRSTRLRRRGLFREARLFPEVVPSRFARATRSSRT